MPERTTRPCSSSSMVGSIKDFAPREVVCFQASVASSTHSAMTLTPSPVSYTHLKGQPGGLKKPVIISPWKQHLLVIVVCALLSWPLSWALIHYADARYGYIDTLLTLLSVWATILLIRKDLHNWVYWILIDAVYVFLYWRSEGYLFALLFLIYAVISVWGWGKWSRENPLLN